VRQEFIDFAQAENLEKWVAEHQKNEEGDWNYQIPHFALDEHHQETHI
jgi:hypothetical protein